MEVSPRICYFPKGLGACRPAALKHVSKKLSHQRQRPVILPGGVEETRKPQHRTPVLTDTHSQGRQFVGSPPEPSDEPKLRRFLVVYICRQRLVVRFERLR